MTDSAEKSVYELKNGGSEEQGDNVEASKNGKETVKGNKKIISEDPEKEISEGVKENDSDEINNISEGSKNELSVGAKEMIVEEAKEEVTAELKQEDSERSKEKILGEGDITTEGVENANLTKQERAIIRQVEYYFGDANLRRDKFLLEQISKDEEGWVPLSVLLTFKRLSSLSDDPSDIIDALVKSDECLLEISDDKKKLRRHPERPIPEHNEEQRKEIQTRTAYAKGFPLDTTMCELIDFFASYEKVLHITMRKYLDKPSKTYKFKGSVFITFAKTDQAREFIEKDKVMYKERELLRNWQEKYLRDKKEETKAKSRKGKTKQAEEEKIQLPKGTVVFFEDGTESVTRELLRGAIEKIEGDWEIAYVDYSKGDKTGHIRFAEENNGAQFLEKLTDKKLKINDDLELPLRILTEEEEKAYLAKAVEQMKNRRNHHHKNKGGHGNRKRRGGYDNRNDGKKKKADVE